MLRFLVVAACLFGLSTAASARTLIVEVFVPNTPAPLTFSADFDPTAIPASGLLPLTNLDFGASTGNAALLVNDAFGTETLTFMSGSVGGVFFGTDLGTFAPGVFAGDVFIQVANPLGAPFTKNVAGEITITPIPAGVVLFGTALAGFAAVRRFRRS
jgi:hypothetical protein